ncbi:polyprenyl synthetase family protein [Salibacteraceae bacterium]|jgi:geranylgeranyl diphosphate synthase, type II|nr:polyprenyl synthetase family protein [Salibacteraceae bacterium]MDB4105904.1 polyprenyl synthetase family protein [Salibacteraceae bacterium]MDB9708336.1 polyprenyl synthetase family protein [Salibacteraceae bacterium]MDC1305015.1 polyprenyl synthetase family protein [Salibacteraceae bacterium]
MDSYLNKLRVEIEEHLSSIDLPSDPANLYEPIEYMLSLGGKRIRPILTLIGCELFGKPYSNAMDQALAVEIFHNFTLVHDDIMDSAEVRRNLPTVHKKWDVNIALLSGDGMIVIAYQHLFKAQNDKLKKLADVFSKTALEVCEGQQYDMDYASYETVSLSSYLEMIRLKTAVLLGGAMQLGAIVADASEKQLEQVQHFAESMGLAFQIKDDYLDSFGDQDSFGKEIGGDIREGKRTWLTLKAFELLGDDNQRLLDAYSITDIAKRVDAVMAIYNELDVKGCAEKEIARYSDDSLKTLANIEGEENVKSKLSALVHYLIDREN